MIIKTKECSFKDRDDVITYLKERFIRKTHHKRSFMKGEKVKYSWYQLKDMPIVKVYHNYLTEWTHDKSLTIMDFIYILQTIDGSICQNCVVAWSNEDLIKYYRNNKLFNDDDDALMKKKRRAMKHMNDWAVMMHIIIYNPHFYVFYFFNSSRTEVAEEPTVPAFEEAQA